MTKVKDLINQLAIFPGLDQETIDFISNDSVIRTISTNEIFQTEGDTCQWVAFVLTGAVQVYRLSENGREQVLGNLFPGMHFNTVPAIDPDCRNRASVRSIGETKLLLIPVDRYRSLLQTHADLAYVVLKDYAKRLDHLTRLVEKLSLHSIRGRLASFLLDHVDQNGVSGYWTQEEIASNLGTVRDVVGRILRSFIDEGIVRRESGKLILLDRKKIEEEAQY